MKIIITDKQDTAPDPDTTSLVEVTIYMPGCENESLRIQRLRDVVARLSAEIAMYEACALQTRDLASPYDLQALARERGKRRG